MSKNILSMGQQNQRTVPSYPAIPNQAVPANRQIVLWQPQQQIFPSADGATYGQMLQDNPLKPVLTSSNDSRTIMVTSVLNPKTGKFDVKVGDKVVCSFGSKKLAEEYARRKGPDLLRDVAPLGDITKGTHPNTNLIQTDKLDDFGNRFNNIDDHLGRLDSRVDGIYQNVDKLKRGVGEANGKIIGKIDANGKAIENLAGQVDDIGQNVNKLKRGLGEANGKIIGKIDGLGGKVDDIAKNVTGMTDKVDDIAKNVTGLTTRVDYVTQNVDKLKRGLGEGLGKVIAKVDDQGKAIGGLTDKVDDIAKQMSKQNGKMALIAGAAVVLAGVAGYLLGKCINNDDKAKQAEETTPVVPPQVEDTEEQDAITTPVAVEPDTIPGQAAGEEPVAPVAPVPPVKPTETDSPIDANGMTTVQKGDGFWEIAERILEYTYKNEPEKFANLSEDRRNSIIETKQKELIELYEKQLKAEGKLKKDEKVKLVKMIINGKVQIVTDPMIHPGQKLQVVEKLDKAA